MKPVISTVKCRDEDELFKTLSEELPVGVCIMQNGKFCYVNSTFPIAIGYTVDELVGKGSLEIVVPEDREMVRENTLKMLKGELLSPYQFRVTCKDGSIVWVMATVKPIQYHRKRATLGNYMEITGRRQLEEALRQSERRYRTILEEMEDGYYEQDLAGNFTLVNDATCRLLGYSRDELMGMNYRVYTPEEDVERRYAVWNKVYRTGEPAKLLPLANIRKDGTRIFVEDSVFPLHGVEGKIVGFRGVSRDITERKKAEEALQQNEEKYRELANSIADVFFAMDEHLRYTYWNKASEILTGIRAEETLGKSLLEVFPDELWRKRAEDVYRSVLKTQQCQIFANDFDIDGRHYTFEISAYPSGGGISVFGKDITERRRAEEVLRRSEERYRTILEETGDGYFESDLAGNFTFVNDAQTRLLGYSREEIIGLNFRAFTPEEKMKSVFEAYNRMYKTGEPLINFPDEVIRKDGSHGFAETSAFPIRNDKGEIIGFRGVRCDITERKKMEETLRQSEERYRTILEETEDSYFEVDLGGHLTFVNSSTCRNLAYSREELIGMSYKGFTAEDDIESVFRVFNEVYRTGVPNKGFPWKIIRKDGTPGFVEASVSLLRDDKGEIIGFRGVGRDISERKKMEEVLRQSEERYRTILEEMEDSYFEVDLGGHLTYVNRSTCRNLGYSREELIGMSYRSFTLEEDIESVFRVFGEVYQTGVPNKGFSWKVSRKDGSHGFAESSVSLLKNREGEIIGLRGVGRDISERKKMEEALRQSEENYRALFDSSVIGTIVLDAETMKVVMANQAAAKILEFGSVEQGIGLNPVDLIAPEDKERTLEVIVKDMFEKDLRMTNEFWAVTKSGREIWISATGARIVHEGKLAGLISFADITEQKLQHEKLMITDRLASIGELAAGAAHELNNPLASIIGLSELLMERNTPDYIRKDLAMIRDEARRAANVTSNLLTFARKHRPVKQLTQINDVIEDVLKLRGYAHKSNCIVVERHLASDLPEMPLDHFQMQQVFLNIVINAEYFMMQAHKKGTLTITTKRQNGSVIVSLADDGPGIPPENLARIFDPFFTTKEAGKGTGLGLSICHGIVAAHGGQIYARSQPGKEATIFIELPINGSNHVEVML